MQLLERLSDVGQGLLSLFGQRHVDHPSILLATLPHNEPRFFQAVDQAGDTRNNRDRAAGDLKTWQRSTFAPQDTQDVVLGWCQIVLPEEPSKADHLRGRTPKNLGRNRGFQQPQSLLPVLT